MSTFAHPGEIDALVHGLDPVDWEQLRLRARLTPGQRILAGLQAQLLLWQACMNRRFQSLI